MLRLSVLSLVALSAVWKSVITGCEAFQLTTPISTISRQPTTTTTTCQFRHTTSLLAAGKRKRRRKTGSGDDQEDDFDATNASDDLPDFDLANDEESSSTSRPKKKPSAAAMDEISPEMMARSSTPARSVKQLIRDRSLETKFVFEDDSVDDSIPDLAVVAASAKQKKTSKQSANKRNAPSAPVVEETPNILEKIPFFRDEYTGKVTALKVLEAGTWMGIILLVLWEVYINTPLFDRAAPITPVVY